MASVVRGMRNEARKTESVVRKGMSWPADVYLMEEETIEAEDSECVKTEGKRVVRNGRTK